MFSASGELALQWRYWEHRSGMADEDASEDVGHVGRATRSALHENSRATVQYV